MTNQGADGEENADAEDDAPTSKISVNVSNVVCHFVTRCHLNLRTICRQAWNVEHNPERNQVTMQLRKPPCYAHIRPSGNVTCLGFRNDTDALIGSRRVARLLMRAGFPVRFVNFRIVNVMANVQLPFRIDLDRLNVRLNETPLNELAAEQSEVDYNLVHSYIYEPELHPAATLKLKSNCGSTREVTFQTFSSGALSILAPNCAAVFESLGMCVPLLATCQFEASRSRAPAAGDAQMYSNSTPRCRALLDHTYARPPRIPPPGAAMSSMIRRAVPPTAVRPPLFQPLGQRYIKVHRVNDALGLDNDLF